MTIQAVVFPNVPFPSVPSAQTNANQFQDALWDFLRTLQRAREDSALPGDDPTALVDVGAGIFASHSFVVPNRWSIVHKHPVNSQWAIAVRPLFVNLVATDSGNPTIATRATQIRNRLTSGTTITLPGGAVITNSFWSVDGASTLTRWNRLKQALDVSVTLTSDWFPDPV